MLLRGVVSIGLDWVMVCFYWTSSVCGSMMGHDMVGGMREAGTIWEERANILELGASAAILQDLEWQRKLLAPPPPVRKDQAKEGNE